MRPYHSIKLTEFPDVGDIRAEGRHSRVGRLDDKSYIRDPRRKAAVRRSLKRADKRRMREPEE